MEVLEKSRDRASCSRWDMMVSLSLVGLAVLVIAALGVATWVYDTATGWLPGKKGRD